MPLAGSWYDYASQVTDAPCFGFAPMQVDCQPCDTVERMLGVGGTECCYIQRVFGLLFCRRTVVMRATDT